MNETQIRRAGPADWQAICNIEEDSFSSPYPSFVLKRLLHDCSENFLVATDEHGNLMGYCVSYSKGKSAHLISIAVLRNHRRRGIASALLQTLVKNLGERRIEEVWLEVKLDNGEAISLYAKFGFERVMVVPQYYDDGSSALKMRLTLQGVELVGERGSL